MEKTLYVHLGPAKTGTSAIQRFLSSNDKLLSDKDSSHVVHPVTFLRERPGKGAPICHAIVMFL